MKRIALSIFLLSVFVGQALAAPDSVPVSEGTTPQLSPAIATDGQAAVTVWSEASPAPSQLRTATLFPNGSLSDARAVHPSASNQVKPAIAFNGSEYLVVWGETPRNAGSSYVMAKRLNRSGEPIEGSAIVLSSGGCVNGNVVVGSDGRDFVVAWQDCLMTSRRLFAMHVSGGAAGAARLITERQYSLDPGGIAWSGEHYLLVWLVTIPGGGGCNPGNCDSMRVEAMHMSRAVEIADFSPVPLSSYYSFGSPRVVWDGSQFAVFWMFESPSPLIYAVRVSPFGVVTDRPSPFLTTGIPRDALVSATFDGSAIVVTWAHAPLGTTIRDVWMARVRFDDPEPWSMFRATNSPDDELSPVVAALRPGIVALANQRIPREQPGSAKRLFVQTVALPMARRRAIVD